MIYTARRLKLEKQAISAALELLAFTRAAAGVLPIPSAYPPAVFLAIGEAEQIRASLADMDGQHGDRKKGDGD